MTTFSQFKAPSMLFPVVKHPMAVIGRRARQHTSLCTYAAHLDFSSLGYQCGKNESGYILDNQYLRSEGISDLGCGS